MSEVKHTPGPWKIRRIDGGYQINMATAIRNPGNYQTHHRVEMDFGLYREDGKQFREAEANARLIAASPDLLKVALMVLDAVDSGDEMAVVDAAREAIAKATGQ